MKLIKGEDYYIDEDGNFVFTEDYHLNRGYCCENGCKHCPYGNANVKKKRDNKHKKYKKNIDEDSD